MITNDTAQNNATRFNALKSQVEMDFYWILCVFIYVYGV